MMNKIKMTYRNILLILFSIGVIGCDLSLKNKKLKESNSSVNFQIVGAMKNVMWKGDLTGRISLDTISDYNGLYGLGPQSYLTGELLINNGITYLSRVTSDSTMTVEKRYDVSAPFFVYANVNEWRSEILPSNIESITDLERFIDEKTNSNQRPFAFKLTGQISKAKIHIQNLPEGAKVSSPAEAHQGQIQYELQNESVEIVGFFSKEHKGVFTHHDSFLHMHLITADESKMGHLDELEVKSLRLYLPMK